MKNITKEMKVNKINVRKELRPTIKKMLDHYIYINAFEDDELEDVIKITEINNIYEFVEEIFETFDLITYE